jgi:hypothetical protein
LLIVVVVLLRRSILLLWIGAVGIGDPITVLIVRTWNTRLRRGCRSVRIGWSVRIARIVITGAVRITIWSTASKINPAAIVTTIAGPAIGPWSDVAAAVAPGRAYKASPFGTPNLAAARGDTSVPSPGALSMAAVTSSARTPIRGQAGNRHQRGEQRPSHESGQCDPWKHNKVPSFLHP